MSRSLGPDAPIPQQEVSDRRMATPLAACSDGADHLPRGTQRPCREWAVRRTGNPARPCREQGASGKRDTTGRRNAHGTEVIVSYRWHPWQGRRARVVRSKAKRSGAVLHVTIERDGRTQLLELPEWMADSAACASMMLADEPVASIDALRSLRELLRVVGSVMVVESQHLGVESQGDADEKTPSSPACSVGSLSSPVGPAAVAGPSVGNQTAGARTGGPAAERTSPRTPDETRRKGRVR